MPRTILEPDARKQQFLDAGVWVFARKGYRQSGVSDIVARAGVARGTFYLYFESKQQLFLAIVEDFHDGVVDALESPAGTLEEAISAWLRFFAARRDQAIVVLKEASSIDARFERSYAELRQSAIDLLAARVSRLQDAGSARADLDSTVAAHLLLGMLEELVTAHVLNDANADLDALASACADVAWRGLRAK